MRPGVKPNKFLQYIPLIGVAALLVFTARILLIVLRLLFCLGALIICILVLRPASYKFVPDNDELYATHVQPTLDPETLIVPKILHQTYKTEDIPQAWKNAQSYCRELHSDFQYMFWTDSSAHAFVASNYSWFLPTYERYPHAIQRVDALRYLLLHHFGGVYLDLDVGCRGWKMDRLLQYPMVLPTTSPVGLSNDVMVSVPHHPLLHQIIHSLHSWNHIYGTKYPTVMFSTGPVFLTFQYALYRYAWSSHHRPVKLIADASNDGGEARHGGEPGAKLGGTLNVHNDNRKVLTDPAGMQRLPHGTRASTDTQSGQIGSTQDALDGGSGQGADGEGDEMERRAGEPGEKVAQQAEHMLGATSRPMSQKNRVLGANLRKERPNLRKERPNTVPTSAELHGSEGGIQPRVGRADSEGSHMQPQVVDLSEVWVLPYELYGHNWYSFFVHYKGNSWHGLDSVLVFWLYHNLNWVFLSLAVMTAAALLGYVVCCQGRRGRRRLGLMHKEF